MHVKTSALAASWHLLSIRRVCRKVKTRILFKKTERYLVETLFWTALLSKLCQLPKSRNNCLQIFSKLLQNHFATSCSCCCWLFCLLVVAVKFLGTLLPTAAGHRRRHSHSENLFIGLSCKIYAALKAATLMPMPSARCWEPPRG